MAVRLGTRLWASRAPPATHGELVERPLIDYNAKKSFESAHPLEMVESADVETGAAVVIGNGTLSAE